MAASLRDDVSMDRVMSGKAYGNECAIYFVYWVVVCVYVFSLV